MRSPVRRSRTHAASLGREASELLREAGAHERAGRFGAAIASYEDACTLAESGGEGAILAEALRGLGVAHHRRGDSATAVSICLAGLGTARKLHDHALIAQALNSLGAITMATGSHAEARAYFVQAIAADDASVDLRARVEQNLGVLANIHGRLDEARAHYLRSLEAFTLAGDEHGCALAHHNLGMLSTDAGRLDEADEHFARSFEIASRAGLVQLEGLCFMNRAEVHLARHHGDDATRDAEAALAIFGRIGARAEQAGAHRMLGAACRESGQLARAEAQFLAAIELASAVGGVLNEAEASRDLALVYMATGRNQQALHRLNCAHRLFCGLDARRDIVGLDVRRHALEDTYLAVVRGWGQTIESTDAGTAGHCARVAHNAVLVARALEFDDDAQLVIRLGAYLHDVGKIRVPARILNKVGALTAEERRVMEMHTIWGVDLLAGVDFPWDIKSIIRSHHERYDGGGYPDDLHGDEIPFMAMIVGIADVFDALTSCRPYRRALTPNEAIAEMARQRSAWPDAVVDAFIEAMPDLSYGPTPPSSASPGQRLTREVA